MKLKKFKIYSDYRNLKGIGIDFPSDKDTVVFIGNNGTGKSNILEALSDIFGKLLYNDVSNLQIQFRLIYELDGKTIVVKNKGGEFSFKVNEDEYSDNQQQYLPQIVVCSYSGEDIRLFENCYKAYQEQYSSAKRDSKSESLKMLYIGRDVWMIVLLVMIINNVIGSDIDKFLKKLGHDINNITAKIIFDHKERVKWKKVNLYTNFIEQLETMMADRGCIDIDALKASGRTSMELFDLFIGIADVIDEIKIEFGDGVDAMLLSEGEKKMMLILFALERLSNEKTLILMDEPDSHIHISRKIEMKDCFEGVPNRNNLITTHSPSLAAAFAKESIIMLDKDADGQVSVVKKDKQQLVADLTDGIWTAQAQNIFLASNKDIIFTEGPTDEDYLSAALKAFQSSGEYSDLAFEFMPCGGASQLECLSKRFIPKSGQTLFAFWDWDDAGEKAMKKIFDKFNTKEDFPRACKANNVWFAFYPRRKRAKAGWSDGFNVEDYFTKTTLCHYIHSFSSLNEIVSKDDLKDLLKKDCIAGKFTHQQLRHFHLVFDLIKEIKQADQRGEQQI